MGTNTWKLLAGGVVYLLQFIYKRSPGYSKILVKLMLPIFENLRITLLFNLQNIPDFILLKVRDAKNFNFIKTSTSN